MTKEDQLRKSSHKLLLVVLKFIPMITAMCYLLNTALALIGIDAPVLSHICGMSLLPWLFILIATYVFKFCAYHRMFLYYILVSDIINIFDYYVGIPLSAYNMVMLHFNIAGIFLFLVLYHYVKCNKEAAGKITE